MEQYKDEVELNLTRLIRIDEQTHSLLKNKKKEYKLKGRKISMAKIVCNLIFKEYGPNKE